MDSFLDDDCSIIKKVIPKGKRLKQAQLPFQSLTSVETQHNVSSKKRKLTSPGDSKILKHLKVTAKENSIKSNVKSKQSNKNADINDEVNGSEDIEELVETSDSDDMNNDKSSDHESIKKHRKKPGSTSLLKPDKELNECPLSSSTLTKFFKKLDNETETKDVANTNMGKTQRTEWTVESIDDYSDEKLNKRSTKNCNSTNDRNEEENKMSTKNKLAGTINTSDSDIGIISSDNEDSVTEKDNDKAVVNIDDSKSPLIPKSNHNREMTQNRKITPKQLEKRKQMAKRREDRERKRMEKEKEQKERENRRKEKEEKRKEKLEMEKAEKEQRKKEKELKEQKKQLEMEQKQKEKEAREQERRKREEAKEEEKKRKEEEKLEAERKLQKTVSTFVSFFVPKKQHEMKSNVDEETNVNIRHFMPFEVKADMRVAPISRRNLSDDEKLALDRMHEKSNTNACDLYLSEIKANKITIHKMGKTWPLEAKDDVVVLDEEENDDNQANEVIQSSIVVEKNRPKLLQFYENRRPPYWGTWRKRSTKIKPRRPFSKDSKWFDYEVDSDEEWEEEEPGESLRGSEDEKDEENPDDNEYDVDNEFMVPHGYLSDEEAQADDEDNENLTPETQKFKLKLLGEEFEAERNAKTLKLKPKLIGCVWMNENNDFPDNISTKVREFLKSHQAWVSQIPVSLGSSASNTNTDVEGTNAMPGSASTRKSKLPDEALPDLIRLIHGNIHGIKFLTREFLTFWNKKITKQLSKASVQHKIREIGKWTSCPEEGPMHLKVCWYVSPDIRKQYLPENEDVPLPNAWKYNLSTPKRRSEIAETSSDKGDKEDHKEKRNVPLITRFAKKITQEEMKQQLITMKSTQSPQSSKGTQQQQQPEQQKQQKPPKRAVLISLSSKEEKPKSEEVPVTIFDRCESGEEAKKCDG